MKCYCPKCGRMNEVSAADVRRENGVVVCPKCLTTFQMPVSPDDDETPPPVPTRRPKAAPKPAAARKSPAAARGRSASVDDVPPPIPKRQPRRPAPPRPAPRPATPRKKPSKAKSSQPMSKIGCILTSVGITAAFFLLYALVGLVFGK